jgi:hypothetical protein
VCLDPPSTRAGIACKRQPLEVLDIAGVAVHPLSPRGRHGRKSTTCCCCRAIRGLNSRSSPVCCTWRRCHRTLCLHLECSIVDIASRSHPLPHSHAVPAAVAGRIRGSRCRGTEAWQCEPDTNWVLHACAA